jgi:N-acetylmuramoyl-L-alanine amidase
MGKGWTATGMSRHGRRVFFALLLLIAGPAWAAKVERVAVEANRVVIRFDEAVTDAATRVLDGGIAVDLPGVKPGRAARGSGLVRSVEQSANGGGTRLFLALAGTALVGDGGFDGDGRELTLTLQPVDARAFARASQEPPQSYFPFLGALAARPRYKVSVPVPPPAKALPLPRVRGDDARPLVVIDAGHGGADPGAINPATGLREKDVTLKVARAIRDELLAGGRVRVALTREDDRFLVLRERFGVARRLKADLFISIHCDSTGNEQASGATVYTLSEVASDKEAARLAARENKADILNGVDLGGSGADVSSILIDLTQRETMNASAGFARLLGREAKPLMPLKANFHRMASLMVLKAPDLPSVLFETGYISNPDDAAFLASADGRERVAQGVARAVEVHFARRLAGR